MFVICPSVGHTETWISSASELLPVGITVLLGVRGGGFSSAGRNFGQTAEYNAEQVVRI